MDRERKRGAASQALVEALDSLAGLRVVLIGGKGGVGKTTISVAAALRFSKSRNTILFTTDPASNLRDLFSTAERRRTAVADRLTIESLDAERLYGRFLDANLESLLEIGDRGTYFDRSELRSFFELSLPGIDELMAWARIGELAEEHADSIIVVDTAPTGHTMRMLSAADHFRQLVVALDAMQEKHRQIARQLTRRSVRDAVDAFIADFDAQARRRRELLTDAARAAFVPVMLSEPWVVEQTKRLAETVRTDGLAVPFAILNRAVVEPDCERDRARAKRDAGARSALAPLSVIDAPRSCVPLDTAAAIDRWGRGKSSKAAREATGRGRPAAAGRTPALPVAHLTFFAGKGGVGKTTFSASAALQLARQNPSKRYLVLSVDPAHALRDVFTGATVPANLAVEIVDTRSKWNQFRETIGREIERAVDAVTPRGLTIAYDADAMQKLVEIAPPGADEIFAITRISDLLDDHSLDRIIIDTAPTGHFLRLLDLPRTAGEWVREFMRILLRYREIIPPGSLGEELLRASRALKALEESLRSDAASVIVVTRPERVVTAETKRLIADLERRRIGIGGVIANYVTPENDCACDRQMRGYEMQALADIGRPAMIVERRDAPVTSMAELANLVSFRG